MDSLTLGYDADGNPRSIVDARFAGGPIIVEVAEDEYRGILVRVEAPGYSVELFPLEAAALAAALRKAATRTGRRELRRAADVDARLRELEG